MVVQVVIELLKKTLGICKEHGVSFSHLPEFSNGPNDWTTALLKSYENFYTSDCLKLLKLNKPGFNSRLLSSGIPSNYVCFSTVIKNIVETVDSATGSNYLTERLKEITQNVNVNAFNDRPEAVEDQRTKTVASELSKRSGEQT